VIGLLTPFSGRHFSGIVTGELDSESMPTQPSMSLKSIDPPRNKGVGQGEEAPQDGKAPF
jgi:hypothetical protein